MTCGEVADGVVRGHGLHPLMLSGKKIRIPGQGARIRWFFGENDMAGEVLVLCSKCVRNPGAEAGSGSGDRAGVHPQGGGSVIVVIAVYRADEGDVIDAGRNLREEIGGEGVVFSAGFDFPG